MLPAEFHVHNSEEKLKNYFILKSKHSRYYNRHYEYMYLTAVFRQTVIALQAIALETHIHLHVHAQSLLLALSSQVPLEDYILGVKR
jgi:hypothetical protein